VSRLADHEFHDSIFQQMQLNGPTFLAQNKLEARNRHLCEMKIVRYRLQSNLKGV